MKQWRKRFQTWWISTDNKPKRKDRRLIEKQNRQEAKRKTVKLTEDCLDEGGEEQSNVAYKLHRLSIDLDCNYRTLASYLGITFDKINECDVGRLDKLVFIVNSLKIHGNYKRYILTSISTYQIDGWYMDIISAIHADYSNDVLLEIARRVVSTIPELNDY